jgi:hypothetical protein
MESKSRSPGGRGKGEGEIAIKIESKVNVYATKFGYRTHGMSNKPVLGKNFIREV